MEAHGARDAALVRTGFAPGLVGGPVGGEASDVLFFGATHRRAGLPPECACALSRISQPAQHTL